MSNILGETLKRAAEHKGASLVEVYQNCNVFNDGAMAYAQEKKQRADNVVELEHGKPLVFANGTKGIRLVGTHLKSSAPRTFPADDLLIHDETDPNPSIHMMLARMTYPTMPEPIGVLRAVRGVSTYDEQINAQVQRAKEMKGEGSLDKLFHSGDTWQVGSPT